MFFFGQDKGTQIACPKKTSQFSTRPSVFASQELDFNGKNHSQQVMKYMTPNPNHVGLNHYLGVSLNGGTPNLHPKMIIFSRKTNGCWVPPF